MPSTLVSENGVSKLRGEHVCRLQSAEQEPREENEEDLGALRMPRIQRELRRFEQI